MVHVAWATDPVWTTVAPMPTARREFATVALGGTIYAIGGYNGPGYTTILGTVEAYDTATNTWTTKASLPIPTNGIQGASTGGTIYIAGGYPVLYGCCSATLWAYDPVTDSWKAKAPMPTPRGLASTAALDGRIYVIGGNNGLNLSTVEMYDPSVDTWVTGASMPTGRERLAITVSGRSIYAIGGGDPVYSSVEAYNPATDIWTTKASLPTPRIDCAAAGAGGLVYVAGGEYPGNPTPAYHSEVYAYNPFTDTWATKSPMPTARDELGVVAIGATIFVIGGGATCDGCAAYNVNEAGVLPPGSMASALAVNPGVQHVGRWVTATLTVTNTGEFVMANLVPSLSVGQGSLLVNAIGSPVPSGTPYLPPGWTQTFTWTFSVSGEGTATFTATVTGYDLASCTTMLVASSAAVLLEPRIVEPPPPPNPLLLVSPGAALDRNVLSLSHGDVVLTRIAPKDATPVTVKIYTASGRLVRTLRRMTPLAEGQWLVSWDGKTEDEMPVSRGVYVVRVSGGGLDQRLKLVVR
mgnify:FL=1